MKKHTLSLAGCLNPARTHNGVRSPGSGVTVNETIQLMAWLICFALCGASVQGVDKWWDIDGAPPGAGGATPAGNWDITTTANWSTDSTGSSTATTFANNDVAIFSAGGMLLGHSRLP